MGKTDSRETVRVNLTKKGIEALRAGKERRTLYDSRVPGLGVMVQPTGHKSFFWFRKVRGRPTWQTIGEFPALSVENARGEAEDRNSKLAQWKARGWDGPDPFERRRDLTLGAVLEDYVERQLRSHAKNPDAAVKAARWKFDRYLEKWKSRPLGSVRREDVSSLHKDHGEEYGRTTANRTVQFLRTLFNWAREEMNWSGENPVKRRFKFFHEASRERYLVDDEMPRLFRALRSEPSADLRDFVLLALMTGARRSDVLSMRWEHLDLPRAAWTMPKPSKRRQPYIVHLVDEAVAVLKARRHKTEGEWVFPGDGRTGHVTGFKRSWPKLLARAKIGDLRIHDLRRTLGSWQARTGASLPIIGETLGHRSTESTEVYARLQMEPVREAVETATSAMIKAAKRKPKLPLQRGS